MRFFGGIMVAFAVLGILFGWTVTILVLLAGRALAARRRRGFCIVVAAIECMMMPLGTILGIFTIIVLARPSVVALFEGVPDAPPASPSGPDSERAP